MPKQKDAGRARKLVYDAIFCALMVVISVLFSSMAYFSRSVFGILIATCIGLYFCRRQLHRSLIVCAVMLLLFLLFQGLAAMVSIYLPNVAAGLVLSLTFRLGEKLYHVITAAALAVISAVEYWLYTWLMLNQSVPEAVESVFAKYEFLQVPQERFAFYSVCFLALLFLVMAAMKTAIAGSIRRIVRKRMPKLDKFLS